MILERLDSAEEQVAELRNFQDKFYQSDKERAILRARVNKESSFEILYGAVLGLGPLLIGLAFTTSEEPTWALAVVGALFTVGAIGAKSYRSWSDKT